MIPVSRRGLSSSLRCFSAALGSLCFWGAAFVWQVSLPAPSLFHEAGERTLPRPEVAKKLALGFDSVAGDIYWVGALQYYSDPSAAGQCYPQMKEYLRLAATLAPEFVSIYRMAGVAIPCHDGREWRFLPEANQFLREGIERFPEYWFLRLLLAHNLTVQGKYEDASRELAQAARLPGAPPFYAGLAARLMATSGRLDAAQAMAEDLLRGTSNQQIRATLERRVRELQVVRDLDGLRTAIQAFRDRHGRFPESLPELEQSGILRPVPAEALGGEWRYDAVSGAVNSTNPVPHVTIYTRRQP